ncbi:TetR family transcriptional regulator [Arthrobacter psychrolactophilus]|uniref:TetR family transcriptional regulator n=1 Tax=Arthrobacter psychrolactophilus TaxID=92442 RepID=A0A2V5IKG3_9MICC|nr:TetR/AcrR family transcriptional regulator [Arthrobacter psychrolactophilus]PYI37158.1 TetR family transcriptional regulator [Arthrobacter psychrolactophilus]
MMQTPRERARQQTMAEIVTIGRRHLELHGAAGLSLRAVARDLGVVSSAIYRYVKNRDELLTLLLVDGYDALGDAVDAAVQGVAEDDPVGRFRALARAVRQWGLAEPACYGLLFGSPVPGYEAPAEQTTAPGTRVIFQLVQILESADHNGRIALGDRTLDPRLAADFSKIRDEKGLTMDDQLVVAAVLVWSALFGAVNFEVFGHYGQTTFSDPAALFEAHLPGYEAILGLR